MVLDDSCIQMNSNKSTEVHEYLFFRDSPYSSCVDNVRWDAQQSAIRGGWQYRGWKGLRNCIVSLNNLRSYHINFYISKPSSYQPEDDCWCSAIVRAVWNHSTVTQHSESLSCETQAEVSFWSNSARLWNNGLSLQSYYSNCIHYKSLIIHKPPKCILW